MSYTIQWYSSGVATTYVLSILRVLCHQRGHSFGGVVAPVELAFSHRSVPFEHHQLLSGRHVAEVARRVLWSVGPQVALDLRHRVLRVAQVRHQQRQRRVPASLGGGLVVGLGEPAALDRGGEQRTVNSARAACVVVAVTLHHPLCPELIYQDSSKTKISFKNTGTSRHTKQDSTWPPTLSRNSTLSTHSVSFFSSCLRMVSLCEGGQLKS